jgi:hypothetical protein
MDLDGLPGPEVVVSAPDLPVNGTLGAGQLFIYNPAEPAGTSTGTINDNSPDANAQFGFSINAIQFAPAAGCGSARPVLLVGADREVFAFFRLSGGPADPRCFK